MDRLFLEQGVTTTEILEIIPHRKPADLVAMLDGTYPASILKHKELLPRYASEQEKQEA